MDQHRTLRRDRSQSLLHLLADREHGFDRQFYLHRRSANNFNVEFFKCITPNLSISNVRKPHNFIRKFSPDGKYLICFSRDQLCFENYKFLGTTHACELVYKWKSEHIPISSNIDIANEIRQTIFDRLFELNWSKQLTTFMRPLYREFSIFTGDGKYVIVASHMPVQEESIPSYYTLNSINRMHFEHDLNWYRFHILKLSDGTVSDTLDYSYDFISLSHNHGVCLNGNTMAVVSLFHQWINIIQLKEGKFVRLFTIGRYLHGTKDCMCSSVPEYRDDCLVFDTRFGGLRHKIIICLYKKILKCDNKSRRRDMLQDFHRRFKKYQSMEIHKIQFIDEENLLIRFDNAKPKAQSLENMDAIKLYVVYNITENEVLNIYPESSRELLWLLSNLFDEFRHTTSRFTNRAPSSWSNNIYLQHAQKRLLDSFPNEKEAAKRLLPQIPLSMQSYTVSPYVDLSIFQYELRLISALERPRFSSFVPIRFSDRDTDVTKFRIYPALYPQTTNEGIDLSLMVSKELVSYIFHPFEPFIISVHKLPHRYITNFHIRNEGTLVKL